MKVLHINCNYFGHNPVHKKMINAMNNINGIDNYVFSPVTEKISVGTTDKILAVKCINKFDRLFFRHKSRKIRRALIKRIDINSINLMHAYTVYTDGNVAYELNKKYGIPYIVVVRNTDVNVFFKYMLHLRNRGIKILKNASRVVYLSKAYQDTMMEKYIPNNINKTISDKSVIIPNGIDDFWLENINDNQKFIENKIELLRNKELKIVYAGDIDKNKNLITTCKTIKLLEKDGWKVEYSVAGRIKSKRVYDKIKNSIDYKGVLEKKELISQYRKAHIFVMPSLTESFGVAYIEAISQGLPVIYSRGQGFDKQFDEGVVGYSVNPKDEYEIKNRINSIVRDYKKMCKNLSKNARKYSWSAISSEYNRIYNSCHVKKNKRRCS